MRFANIADSGSFLDANLKFYLYFILVAAGIVEKEYLLSS